MSHTILVEIKSEEWKCRQTAMGTLVNHIEKNSNWNLMQPGKYLLNNFYTGLQYEANIVHIYYIYYVFNFLSYFVVILLFFVLFLFLLLYCLFYLLFCCLLLFSVILVLHKAVFTSYSWCTQGSLLEGNRVAKQMGSNLGQPGKASTTW